MRRVCRAPSGFCTDLAVTRLALTGLAWAALFGLSIHRPVAAQTSAAPASSIYTCVDSQGRRLTSDRPINDCSSREQKVLNRDGSLQRVLPPTLTAEERADREAAQRQADLQRAAQADAVRRDRNLLVRFPNEAVHRKSREAALDTVRLATRATEKRVKELSAERKPLLQEAEFYKGRQLPVRLKQSLDAVEAGVEAQRGAAANQEAEVVRINRLHDVELERLRLLWAGAQPGSLGPVGPVGVPAKAAVAAPVAPATSGIKPASAAGAKPLS